MLLTIDVGNTQTVLGLYDPDTETGDGAAVGLVDHWRISTVHERTSDEYSVMVRSMLDTIGVDFDTEITGTAICSGVRGSSPICARWSIGICRSSRS